MRRTDRELCDYNEIQSLLERTMILHLALLDDGFPYIIPLHYASDFVGKKLVFYMHSAKDGHKLDLINKNQCACIEIENDIHLISGDDIPCQYGSEYSSLIATGKIRIVDDSEEKKKGLRLLMKHQTGRDFEFSDTMIESVAVLEFVADSYSAKARKTES